MYTNPSSSMIGERLFSGLASGAISLGMVLALVSLSGVGSPSHENQSTLAVFDVSAPGSADDQKSEPAPPPEPSKPTPASAPPPIPIPAASRPAPQPQDTPPSLPQVETPNPAASATPQLRPSPAVEQRTEPAPVKPESPRAEAAPRAAQHGPASPSYKAEVWRHLQQFRGPNKVGPGTTFVSFTLDASGNTVVVSISRSSGSRRFDMEALQVVRRAQPFPKPPANEGRSFVFEIKGS